MKYQANCSYIEQRFCCLDTTFISSERRRLNPSHAMLRSKKLLVTSSPPFISPLGRFCSIDDAP